MDLVWFCGNAEIGAGNSQRDVRVQRIDVRTIFAKTANLIRTMDKFVTVFYFCIGITLFLRR